MTLYKGKYFIIFYDSQDERPLYIFNGIKDILLYMGKPITKANMDNIKVILYRALKKNHRVRFLTGEILHVYVYEDDDDYLT